MNRIMIATVLALLGCVARYEVPEKTPRPNAIKKASSSSVS